MARGTGTRDGTGGRKKRTSTNVSLEENNSALAGRLSGVAQPTTMLYLRNPNGLGAQK